jgi:hypothetical protein
MRTRPAPRADFAGHECRWVRSRSVGPRVRSSIVTALLAASALGAVASASASDVHRFAILEARDPVLKTVQLNGETYHSGPRTCFKDLEGNAIALADLVPTNTEGLFSLSDATIAEFRATQVRGKWLLRNLRLVHRLPD